MKHIKNMVFELKLPKVQKSHTAELMHQYKSSVVHVVKALPADDNVKMEDVLGKVTMLSLLNNKTIVRIDFNNMSSIIEADYIIRHSPKNGFVLVPA